MQQNYGAESGLLMQTMTNTDVNLQKPYVSAVNATGNGIVHSVDGSSKYPPTYTTNDVNALSNYAIAKYASQDTDSKGNRIMGDGYLGGV